MASRSTNRYTIPAFGADSPIRTDVDFRLVVTNHVQSATMRYRQIWLDQYKGFEPSPTEWKSVMLPLHQYWIKELRFLSQPCINIIPRFLRIIKFLHTQTYKLELWFEVAARKTHYRNLWPRSYCYTINYLQGPLTQAAHGASEWTRTTDLSGMNGPL